MNNPKMTSDNNTCKSCNQTILIPQGNENITDLCNDCAQHEVARLRTKLEAAEKALDRIADVPMTNTGAMDAQNIAFVTLEDMKKIL